MNKNEFYQMCAKKLDMNKSQLEKVMEGVKDCLMESLSMGQVVNFNGVGKFFIKFKPAKTITSNLNGKELIIDQKFQVAFKSSKKLSRQII